jgi:putative tricarboxylic transport membrane protein
MTLRRDGIAALALLALTVAAWLETGAIPGEARLFPRLVLGAMAVLSAVMLVRSFARRSEAGPFFLAPGALVVTLALAVVYIAAVEVIGYLAATALFVPGLALALGLRRPVLLALTTAGFVAAVHLVFVVLFGRPLPLGLLGD